MITNTLAIVCLVLAGALWAAAGMSFWQWLVDLDARSVWHVDPLPDRDWSHVPTVTFDGHKATDVHVRGGVITCTTPRTYTVPGVPFTFDHRGYVTGWKGRRANFIPRAGQVWRSSDPRRLSAFRIVHVSGLDVAIEMITNPGITGRTGRTVSIRNFQILGPKGYTRVA